MKILFLTQNFPSSVGGERLRPYRILEQLSKKHTVKLFCFYDHKGPLFKNVSIYSGQVNLTKPRSWWNSFFGLFSRSPIQVAYFYSAKMKRLIKEELQTNEYDLIFCHLIRMAEYVKEYKKCKKVLDMCDALSKRYEVSCRYRGFPFGIIESEEAKRLKVYEKRIAECFDLTLVASDDDKEYLEKNDIKNIGILENGAEVKELDCMIDSNKIVFFANFRAFPNRDALNFFINDIFPIIRARNPTATLTIAGAFIPKRIKRLNVPSFQVKEFPVNMEDIVKDSCVSVVPMRIAVGIQNKVIQSMGWGVPVVSTSMGLGSIRAVPGVDILVADDPVEFAEKVLQVMSDRKLRASLSKNGTKVIKEHYQWEDIARGLEMKMEALT